MRTAPGPAVVVMVGGGVLGPLDRGEGGRGSRVLVPENLRVRLLGVGVL